MQKQSHSRSCTASTITLRTREEDGQNEAKQAGVTFNSCSDGSADCGVREWQERKESCRGVGVKEEEENEDEEWWERSVPARCSSD